MKNITFSDEKVDNFGGLIAFQPFCQSIHLNSLVTDILGNRVSQAIYSFTDVLTSHTSSALCGGEFIEDFNKLREKLPSGQFSSVCSTDIFQNVVSQLSHDGHGVIHETETGKTHDFCFHPKLNKLLSRLGEKALVKDENKPIILDHDHTKVPTQKRDSRACYKGTGYYLSVFSTQNIPLYLSSQSGNSVPASDLQTVLEHGLKHLDRHNLSKESIFRADGGCYNEEVLKVIRQYCTDFLIRSESCNSRASLLEKHGKQVQLNQEDYYVYSYKDSFAGTHVRRILYMKVRDRDDDLFPYKNYKEVITSLEDRSPTELIKLYNQRGTSEQLFDELKADYNLARPPFSDLQYNNAYFIICALSCVLGKLFTRWVCEHQKGIIHKTARIKQLTFRLLAIPGKLVSHARKEVYKLYTTKKRLRCFFSGL